MNMARLRRRLREREGRGKNEDNAELSGAMELQHKVHHRKIEQNISRASGFVPA
jgi:hypothetical protein